MATPLEQLDAMRGLAPNWDGYKADAPVPAVLDRAKEFVAILEARFPGRTILVYPGRAGGVQLEWEDDGFEHELELDPDGSLGLLHVEKATGAMRTERFGAGDDLSRLDAALGGSSVACPSEPGA